ncbi:hypothetical protein V7426_28825 [Bacillus thuringiensis]|uniref:hypothetical protein n=1 Tax=Bacillus cereus group TaxID=86661 RepID=UPI001145CF5F|nr:MULTISPECIES: hypothetical protein [Bacillus cereus group]
MRLYQCRGQQIQLKEAVNMILELKMDIQKPKVGDIVVIMWKHTGGKGIPEAYILSNQVLGNDDRTFKLLNVNGSSIAFDESSIDKLMKEVSRHTAVEAFKVYPQSEFKLTLKPIGGAE